jgi:hypothetical protein
MAQAKMKQADIPKHFQVIEEHPSSGHEEDHDHGHALSWREINRVLFVHHGYRCDLHFRRRQPVLALARRSAGIADDRDQ